MHASSFAAQVSTWWLDGYTRTAPQPDGADRRAEVRADIHDELADARARDGSDVEVAVSVLGRTVRGMPADVGWRVRVEARPERVGWHLDRPATVLTWLFVALVPVTLVADGARSRGAGTGWHVVLTAPLVVLASLALVLAGVALGRRLASRTLRVRPVDLRGVRRGAVATMCVLWSVAALWRFAPPGRGVLSTVSAVAWAGFGGTLVVYLGAVAASLLVPIVDNRKVSS